MVAWWKRFLYSLASVAIPPVTALLCAIVWRFTQGFGSTWLAVALILYFEFSLFGWVLALPFVLRVTDFRGWRGFMWISIGSLLGPVLVGGVSLIPDAGLSPLSPGSAGISAAASGLATMIYVALLSRAQKKAPEGP